VTSSAERIDEERLVQLSRDGDAAAFGALVRLYSAKIYNIVAYMVSDAVAAEDLTQDTFLKAFKAIKFFKGNSGFYTWLYRIAVNTALSHRRGGERESAKIDSLVRDGVSRKEPAGVDPVGVAESQEKKELVRKAIQRLSEEESTVIILRDIEGLSYAEIAEALDVPAGTVRSRLFRGRMALKDILKGMFGEV